MKLKLFVIAGVLSMVSNVGFTKNPTAINYNTDVTLKGYITKTAGYPTLNLKEGITAIATPDNVLYGTEKNVKRMQIAWSKGTKLPTGCVIATGQLYGAHTAHHKTSTLIDLKSYKKCK
ncbi:hypothetical protein [Phocoenobacter skyensis]|uniref:hypothetical protein n=1 Tax=Phocoenobacter skyensis TaxID=97481 RepID=UPI00275AC376|nr:hypothetical protein [Pasteurella skyensis]MDP8185342.1 hypothetical protein [Pasteurella skyensis]